MPDNVNRTAPWGSLDTNDKLDLAALKIDVALIRQSNDQQSKSLDRIEMSVNAIPAMMSELRVGLSSTAERVTKLEQKTDSIDENIEQIKLIDVRVGALEKNLINNGELRMATVENTLKEAEVRAETQKGMIVKSIWGIVSAALVGGGGFVLVHLILPQFGLGG